jgi:preprotein translocase subunit SecD
MVAVRLLRTLAPIALIALVATACGSGSSSGPSSSPSGDASASSVTSTSDQLEIRPVFARYSPGPQIGPGIPTELKHRMQTQKCPMKPAQVEGMLMECDPKKTVYLMKPAITTGGVKSAVAEPAGAEWFVKLSLDPATASKLKAGTTGLTGTDLAFSLDGKVLASVIVDSSLNPDDLGLTGGYDKATATQLAQQIMQTQS